MAVALSELELDILRAIAPQGRLSEQSLLFRQSSDVGAATQAIERLLVLGLLSQTEGSSTLVITEAGRRAIDDAERRES